MFDLIKISGKSLQPVYQDGDFVFICKIPFCLQMLHPGDAILFNHKEYGKMIKLIEQVNAENEEIFVIGTHEDSVDSRRFGPIHRQDVIGKVFCHIRQN